MRPATSKVTSAAGKVCEYVLDGVQYTIGRVAPHHEPDIVLAPDPQGISRLHCILDLEYGQWWVTDHARNGILLQRDDPEAEIVPVRGRRLLKHGDTLLILGDMLGDDELLYWRLTYVDAHATRPAPVHADLPAAAPAARPGHERQEPPRPGIRYDAVGSRVYRVEGDREILVEGLRPKGHQLLRPMVSRGTGRTGLVPRQATFAPSRRPARPLAAPAESPRTSSTRASGRHAESTHRTPLLDGQTLPAGALEAVACDHEELITALWRPREEWPLGRGYDRTDLAGVVRAVRRRIEPDPSRPRILETVPTVGYRLYVHFDEPAGRDGRPRG